MNIASSSAIWPRAFPIGPHSAMTVVQDGGGDLRVAAGAATVMRLRFDESLDRLKLSDIPDDLQLAISAVAAAAEAMFGWRPGLDRLVLDLAGREALARELMDDGLAVTAGTELALLPELVMQRRGNWLVNAEQPPMPQLHVMTDGKRHPRRSPKPAGKVYARFIPWLAAVISFRVANLDGDLQLLHRWMNDPRVDAFWNEAGDLEKHRRYLSGILADPHMLPLIGCFDDEP